MTIHLTWALFGHLCASLLLLFGTWIGVMIWVWEFDERFPLPVRIIGLLITAICIVSSVGIWL